MTTPPLMTPERRAEIESELRQLINLHTLPDGSFADSAHWNCWSVERDLLSALDIATQRIADLERERSIYAWWISAGLELAQDVNDKYLIRRLRPIHRYATAFEAIEDAFARAAQEGGERNG